MNLHDNKELFMDAIAVTAQRMDIQEIFVEKDYWICYALNLIFQSQMKEEAIFKGGTALSKCYQLIDRFSEDIDLVVLRHGEESVNQLKNKLKKITQTIKAPLTEQDMEGITNKLGMIRKIAYNYPKMFQGNFGQVRDTIIIEATWLGHFEPYSKKMISSYIYEMMMETGQAQMAEQYGLQPFEALVLDKERTLCEKIMSLVRFSYSENPIQDLRNKIRHVYDIHQLLKDGTLQGFFGSPDFEAMLLRVIDDDVQSFKNNNDWLDHHPKEALIFKEPKQTWDQLKGTYQNEFKELVFGEFPKEEEILATIIAVAKRLEELKL
ncbi:nucleotidyl transferase AbiEii/AbiGii toxin family protein [Allomuricauda taeanensis]|uniref:nucleotidyl transferase AbiEii/AbiGii toxin family protein n=1 Tax=Flagellimonas taeanensis TaxID=1005926 RepID=UPI002E7C443C|nr:nucleotidyl transferase AbiEii/AbiGii toxin family protein [Allomuricauda taeanensis]MEE1963912.1 nucleotidyl transferase AbiEii/AbiGii toxin family protein [Allomuricauda taeanensis]